MTIPKGNACRALADSLAYGSHGEVYSKLIFYLDIWLPPALNYVSHASGRVIQQVPRASFVYVISGVKKQA